MMVMEKRSFEPDWALPPGAIVEDVLEERGIRKEHLAERLGMSAAQFSDFVAGHIRIDAEMAELLGRELGPNEAVWLRLQAMYEAALARLAKAAR
jgi:addiction module HigA family antidote